MSDSLLCKILGHRVSRKRVRRSGDTLVGRCARCRTRMEKGADGWVVRSTAHELDPA